METSFKEGGHAWLSTAVIAGGFFCEFGGEVGGGSIIRGCSWGFDESIGRRER